MITSQRKHQLLRAPIVIWAFLFVLVGVPIAIAVGIGVHNSRSLVYAQQVQTDTVTAVVTSDRPIHQELAAPQTVSVPARWFAAGTEHAGAITAPQGVKTGDSVDIQVDAQGYHVTPAYRTALDEAVAVGLSTWLSVGIVAAIVVTACQSAIKSVPNVRQQLRAGHGRGIRHEVAGPRLTL